MAQVTPQASSLKDLHHITTRALEAQSLEEETVFMLLTVGSVCSVEAASTGDDGENLPPYH